MKRLTAGLFFTSIVALCFAACHSSVAESTFQGHPAYAPPVSDDGNGPPAKSSGIACSALGDCDFWLCHCSDGALVASSICENGFCLNADGACSLACDYFGDGTFTGAAQGGPGSGIGGPGDGGGGGGGAGGGDCAAVGDDCGSDDECCSGFCDDSGVCADSSSCGADGDACGSDDECCGGVCGDDGTCGGSSSSCGPSGDFCGSDDDCCSGVCDSDGACI